MGILLAPATRKDIEISIEHPVSIELVEKYFRQDFVDYIFEQSDYDGIRCWGMAKDKNKLFDETEEGDDLLLTEEGAELFTQYGMVIGKVKNKRFGQTLWLGNKENPWEYIYFMANVHKIEIDKKEILFDLQETSTVHEPIRVALSADENLFSVLAEDEEILRVLHPECFPYIVKELKPDISHLIRYH